MIDTPKSSMPKRGDGAPWRNFYGRRHGKTLRKSQIMLLGDPLKRRAVPGVGWDENPARTAIDLQGLFGRSGRRVLEVGFGGGEHLAGLAAREPEVDFIGCEPFVNGVAMLLAKLEAQGSTNVRVHPGDARDLLDVLPEASLSACYLLYPDPWPKTRHHRRRFINPDAIDPLAHALEPGAELRIATDIEDYVRHSLVFLMNHPLFVWVAERPEDWRAPWEGWIRTRYEAKALQEGRRPHYLRFRRV